jgi:hypothetical protein
VLVLLIDREHVHVAVEHQMAPRSWPCEGAHDVWHAGLGCNHTEGKPMRFQETGDVCGGKRRVTGWVRTFGADEVAQKINDLVAILVDPSHELLFQSVHS